jgi:nicotinamide riboside kinase
MKRVAILGRGASGKSTLAIRLGEITGLPVIELDKLFWKPNLDPTPRDQWSEIQQRLAADDRWIIDGDLGPYDVLDIRLSEADTVILLDLTFLRCAWRAFRRSRERLDFWNWLILYRWRYRPVLLQSIAKLAGSARIQILRSPSEVEAFVTEVSRELASGSSVKACSK